MGLRRGLSIGGRLVFGLLLIVAMVFVARYCFWQAPRDAWRGPLSLPLFLILASLLGLLIRSFCRATVGETAVIIAIIFVLECSILPAVDPHSGRHRPKTASPSAVQP